MLWKTFLPHEENPVYDCYSQPNTGYTFPQNNFKFKTAWKGTVHQNAKYPF